MKASCAERALGGGHQTSQKKGLTIKGHDKRKLLLSRIFLPGAGGFEVGREVEKITVDVGPKTLDAIRERARSFKSPLNRLA
jgi:hypothetical protein